MNPGSFFSELKRRNVYKVAVAYAVIGWLLIQIATQTFPFLEIPNWAIRLVIMLVAIGFPIALILAWAFELTPEGLKRTEFADELPTKSARSRVWIYVVITAGAISVSLFFRGRYTSWKESVELPEKSIAVLPFENLSGNPENAYFTDGIQEKFDEAIRELKRGLELDPLSLPINGGLGRIYYFARRYDEAIEQLRKTSEMDPGFYYAHWNLGSALAAKGAIGAAIEEYQKARALDDDPFVLGLLARAYGFSGNKVEAEKILNQLTELSRKRYVSAYSFALVYLGLGDKEETLRWLEKSYQDLAGNDLAYIKVEPLLDPLRGDPRFEALVAKVFAPKNGSSP